MQRAGPGLLELPLNAWLLRASRKEGEQVSAAHWIQLNLQQQLNMTLKDKCLQLQVCEFLFL